MMVEVGQRIAVIGPNGIGKTTFLKTLFGELPEKSGEVKWSQNAKIGYYAQDNSESFREEISVFEWMSQWRNPGDDDQSVRGILGRLLFTQDDIKKPVSKLSGGEKGRMMFGKLMMVKPNILIMDEPTNHLDMESIESLNMALQHYEGTLIFVSHDREFVASLSSRILVMHADGMTDFPGKYEDYLASRGIISAASDELTEKNRYAG